MPAVPKILRVESGSLSLEEFYGGPKVQLLDVHSHTPRVFRKIERLLRLEIFLAIEAKKMESRCDIVWAGSEKEGIPLSLMGLRKPLVVIAHHMASPLKARFAHLAGILTKWSGIGYISDEGKDFIIQYFGVEPGKLFQYESSKYLEIANYYIKSSDGPIISVGVAKRDYPTLIKALAGLHGYESELFISSKFGDRIQNPIKDSIPAWVNLTGWLSDHELLMRYAGARFIVVPLQQTTHDGAGINAVLEASAFGKAVIATHTGGMPTFVKEGQTGILVPPYNVVAWQEAIQLLWTNPELANQMGVAGRSYIEKRFNPSEVDAKISAFLINLFANQRK